ncbi:hypothetical protein CWI39_1305p0010 [Hamiltosporidium magnivora]|uniref:Uncharacterized protein n=1 Tax=Hamiltosporidium magnivora TaxID=148818 RepID=A0A4Q9L3P6_9MICR|nr:hypothetical protein CWI39_1305p0010 [Hamiltosporidium magnivora]
MRNSIIGQTRKNPNELVECKVSELINRYCDKIPQDTFQKDINTNESNGIYTIHRVILRASANKRHTTLLKQVCNEEDGVTTKDTKNILTLIFDYIAATAKKLRINSNEESYLEKAVQGLKVRNNYLKVINLIPKNFIK